MKRREARLSSLHGLSPVRERGERVCEIERVTSCQTPYDVCELNNVLSHDDDEQIVALDASMRLEDRIR